MSPTAYKRFAIVDPVDRTELVRSAAGFLLPCRAVRAVLKAFILPRQPAPDLAQVISRVLRYEALRGLANLPRVKFVDIYDELEVVALTYDAQKSKDYDAGHFIGFVIKREGESTKVRCFYDEGGDDIAWVSRSTQSDRWIDKTWRCIVELEEGAEEERKFLRRIIPPQRLEQILREEGIWDELSKTFNRRLKSLNRH